MNGEFVYLDEHLPGVRWDTKYATWDNFTGQPVDGYHANRIIGTRAISDALARVRDQAAGHGLGLLVWDGYRPQRAVDGFLRWSAMPEDDRTKSRHYPNIDRRQMFELGYVAEKSGHSRGSTVDLTLFDLVTGTLLPMGGDHDLMDTVSHHDAEGVSQTETWNRQRLRSLMEACGFSHYVYEWWHYTLRHEPHPDTYFDFPIT